VGELSGAGGNWPRQDERPDDSVICQFEIYACTAACAQMLLAEQGVLVDQQVIAEACGQPSWPGLVARIMREIAPASANWDGGSVGIAGVSETQMVRLLCRTGSWGAVLWEPGARIGHMVIVDHFEAQTQCLSIRDPWPPGTRYTMSLVDFVNWWSMSAVFRRLG
jgi:hypothetical protein